MSVESIDAFSETSEPDIGLEQTVDRRAFYLDSEGHSLFTWLHTHATEDSHDHGVVICPPIGFEQIHSHRSIRHLADHLASRQFPTLRFDWAGTGDSTGNDLDPNRLATWKANVRSAVQWMKHHQGCRQVSVIGLRMGATIAALSLDADEVDNLVLWAPITSGRAYVRELTLIEKTSGTQPTTSNSSGVIDAAGFLMSRETATELSKVNLLNAQPRCRQVLLSDRDDALVDQRLLDQFTRLHIHTEQQILPGLAEMMAEPHRSTVPSGALWQIGDWIQRQADAAGTKYQSMLRERPQFPLAQQAIVIPPDNERSGVCEELFPISKSPLLFGIVSRPVKSFDADLPMIVLLNAGATNHTGPGRMSVEASREFATHGFTTLRFDFCGLGDSVTTAPEDENDSYVRTMFRDIEITLQQAKSRLGIRRCVLIGLCSGAYAAFQAAAQIEDAALVESIMINPLTYFWRDGMSLDEAPSVEMIHQHYYMQSALDPRKWRKLLTGKSRIGLTGAFRILARRLGWPKSASDSPPKHRKPETCLYASHPGVSDLNGDLKRVASNRRPLTMFFASTDPGYGILMRQARWRANSMIRRGEIDVTFIDNADHTFSRRAARQELIQKLVAHLCKRYEAKSPALP